MMALVKKYLEKYHNFESLNMSIKVVNFNILCSDASKPNYYGLFKIKIYALEFFF